MSTSFSISGDKELMKFLKTAQRLELAREVVKNHGSKLDKAVKRKAVFTKGYSTGATKRSIKTDIEDGGMTAHTQAGTDYSGYLEKGTRFMEAQPFMGPAHKSVKDGFLQDLERVMK